MSYFKKIEVTDGVDDLEINPTGSLNIQQDVIAVPENSSEANLAVGATFTGEGVSTLGVVGLQTSLKTDQNCTVYVDQSPDGTSWDIVDI